MPGPSFAPLFGGVRRVPLVFGLVAGGLVAVARRRRPRAHAPVLGPRGARATTTTRRLDGAGHDGQRPTPARSPGASAPGTPPGVHMPPPSFRPLLVALAMTLLVAGLVFGGWALVLGFDRARSSTLLELAAATRAASTARRSTPTSPATSTPGRRPAWPTATFAALARDRRRRSCSHLGLLPNSASGDGRRRAGGRPRRAGRPAAGASAAPGGPSLPARRRHVTAQNTAFVGRPRETPAGKPFTIAFDNQDDGQPHNVAIHDARAPRCSRARSSPASDGHRLRCPRAHGRQYTFVCTVHPNMTGTATAK